MAEKPRLDVLPLQRLAEKRIVEEVDLADGEIVRRPPVGVHPPKFICGERIGG
jgi:hypothetical protein